MTRNHPALPVATMQNSSSILYFSPLELCEIAPIELLIPIIYLNSRPFRFCNYYSMDKLKDVAMLLYLFPYSERLKSPKTKLKNSSSKPLRRRTGRRQLLFCMTSATLPITMKSGRRSQRLSGRNSSSRSGGRCLR